MKTLKKLLLINLLFFTNYLYALTVLEDAEDNTTEGWSVRSGADDAVANIYDETSASRVIQLTGGGSNILGAIDGEGAFGVAGETTIRWRMAVSRPFTIYVMAETLQGIRYIFYTVSPNRGLLHGFQGAIMHGLTEITTDGRWRTITRDLQRDLKNAEPENEIVTVNGFIYNGGDGGMIDDIILYNPNETVYENGENGTDNWQISEGDPTEANVSIELDDDNQGRSLQGNVIQLEGNGFENAYLLGAVSGSNVWSNQTQKLLQWRFRDFGGEFEVLSADPDERGTVRDMNAFEFRVYVETTDGLRDLTYTLGTEHLGIIEDGTTIHHALGDDRTRGSIWAGDDPLNEMGLWQTVTRDLEEDIRDFEPNNRLVAVNGFQVRNNGFIDDIKMLSEPVVEANLSTSSATKKSVPIGWLSMLLYSIALLSLVFFFLRSITISGQDR